MAASILFGNAEKCFEHLGREAFGKGDGLYCNGTFDSILCWPATKAGEVVRQKCPRLRGLDPNRLSERRCGLDGYWLGKYQNETSNTNGWTNYTGCYIPEVWDVYSKMFVDKPEATKLALKSIAYGTRTMEIVGLTISLVSLLISSFVFLYFRSLKCHRTRIHKNLFGAMIIQVVIRLLLYIDQFVSQQESQYLMVDGRLSVITSIPSLCKTVYSLLEYSKTVCFMWMFLEGFYLHNMIVVSVFSGNPNYKLYYLLGWGSPIVSTGVWATVMIFYSESSCWLSYYFFPYIWIMDGQRLAVIVINLTFLFNIMRILITKLRESHTNEAETLRKAVKAAIVLLPLLGITNFVVMIEPSQENVALFGTWAYISYFLISFQGFGISLIYCFLNSEVQATLKRCIFHDAPLTVYPVVVRVEATKVRNEAHAIPLLPNSATVADETKIEIR
ncbi:PDF receptor isoform X2 [Octopus bimaculoides]|uniref:PDF receptor isoform X2 n=1 Tax=Octopus bimaculoides TaxID=37653 RepID=UPI0022E055EC|nr:PDF receptor isoform X2 [Octopus bimaculoides]